VLRLGIAGAVGVDEQDLPGTGRLGRESPNASRTMRGSPRMRNTSPALTATASTRMSTSSAAGSAASTSASSSTSGPP